MVKITINGKKNEREFPNMAHALAFAYQNGECYSAEKIEIVKTADKQGAKEPEQKQTETAAGGDNPAQAVTPQAPQEPVGTPIGPEETHANSGTGEAVKEAGGDNPAQAV